jgi:hypothetical protein
MAKIGGDCNEYADKFETIEEVLSNSTFEMKEKGIPTHQRKYLLRMRELLKRGVLSFSYLERRTCTDPVAGRD